MSDADLWNVVENATVCTLATIKKDGRPQLSDVGYAADPATRTLRISTIGTLAKIANLRRDPRGTIRVGSPGGGYVAAEVEASMSAPSADPHDATVEELIDIYRQLAGEHPDWDEFRRAMVADGRLVLTLQVGRLVGWLR